ncbi:MAG TPA: deoxyribose-phosphate aldolase [Lentisphaeria bacterium]|nr:MAG: deoxyribose-phosphate aldolase [Lentisphaerae bacterium GWF2_49_21]HBC85994.1 deoxyribose-phosphate aldolase [Lentisphaeria bacterium]
MNTKITAKTIAKMIDHSLLHPTMTDEQIREGCELSRKFDVATACVKPYSVPMAKEILAGTDVKVCSVIGFPHGNNQTSIKVKETELAIKEGATEIDMVINIGKALGGQWDYVTADIKAVNDACVARKMILKVIFENDYLEDKHIIRLCEICSSLKVAFAKTSTGYGFVKQPNGMYNYQGAIERHLKLMRKHCSPDIQIKAAGGVRTLDDTLAVRSWGVTRIGATATKVIVEEAQKRESAGTLKLPDDKGAKSNVGGTY